MDKILEQARIWCNETAPGEYENDEQMLFAYACDVTRAYANLTNDTARHAADSVAECLEAQAAV